MPGAKGDAGTDGTDGADGVNAYTTTSANFAMPDGTVPGTTVTVTVASTDWMSVGQVVYVEGAGWMRVDSITNSTTVLLLNLEDGTGIYLENVAPTTVVPAGSKVSPGGLQGATGATAGAAGGDLDGTYPNPTLEITTTKGDLIVNNLGNVAPRNTRQAVGADDTVLHADSGTGTGLAWRGIDVSGANTSITGALPIANGGTGAAAKTAAFDALSPVTTKGDLIVRNAANNVRQAVGADGTILVADSTQANGVRWGGISPDNFDTDAEEVTVETIILRDVKNSNVDGDVSGGAGSWAVRDITEISEDTSGAVVLAAEGAGHKFTMDAGFYRIHAVAVGYQIGYHLIRLVDVNSGNVVPYAGSAGTITGITAKSPAGSDQPTISELHGRFEAIAGHAYCIQHYAQLPAVAAGYGKAASILAVQECYMTVMIEKLAKQ